MTGATIGLTACTTALNSYLSSYLPDVLSNDQLTNLLQSVSTVDTFSPELRSIVELVYGDAYNLQIKVLLALTAVQIPVIFLAWRTPQLGIHEEVK
jgi:hypothetical protein